MRKRLNAVVFVPDPEVKFELIRQLRDFGVTPAEIGGQIAFSYYGESATISDLIEIVQDFGDFQLHTTAEV